MPFTKGISTINNTQIDHAKDDVVIPTYNLIEYSNDYSKTSGSLCQYYWDEPNNNITEFESFKSTIKRTGKSPDDSITKNVEIVVPLKFLSNFWRTLGIILDLTWSKKCVISSAVGKTEFAMTDTKLCVPVITLPTED